MTRRRRVLLVALVALASLGVSSTGMAAAVVSAGSSTKDGAPARYIVRLTDPAADPAVGSRVGAVLRDGHGTLVAAQEALGTLVVQVTPSVAAALGRTPGVAAVTPDAAARMQSLGFDPAGQPGSMTNLTRVTGAQTAWKKGYTGSGVDVAVIDTGVAPVSSLSDSSKVVVGPDLSFESQAANLRYLDTFGHGTHMSSIIAGREVAKASGSTYAADTSNFYGMAPDARIISIKVGDHNGTVDVSQLIAAIDWVVAHRTTDGMNIRVLNLSFGTDSTQSYVLDPLAYAAEVAWNYGIFVVASAGNDGSRAKPLANPAYDQNLFAVGAADTKGTDSMSDDSVAEFSQHPMSSYYERVPDLVAPGVKVVASGVPGSYLYAGYPSARYGNGFLRGSGTSQAAAVVSGAAAVLLQRWPSMDPGDLKELLTRTATPLSGISAALQGRGELNVAAAVNSAPLNVNPYAAYTSYPGNTNYGVTAANGYGSLEGSRGSYHVSMDGVTLTGETDIMSKSWVAMMIAMLTRSLGLWSGGSFNGAVWIGGAFAADTTSWAGRTWGGRTWASSTWTGRTWSGSLWSGRTWSASTWNGRTWSSCDWDGDVDPKGFTSRTWSTSSWA